MDSIPTGRLLALVRPGNDLLAFLPAIEGWVARLTRLLSILRVAKMAGGPCLGHPVWLSCLGAHV